MNIAQLISSPVDPWPLAAAATSLSTPPVEEIKGDRNEGEHKKSQMEHSQKVSQWSIQDIHTRGLLTERRREEEKEKRKTRKHWRFFRELHEAHAIEPEGSREATLDTTTKQLPLKERAKFPLYFFTNRFTYKITIVMSALGKKRKSNHL